MECTLTMASPGGNMKSNRDGIGSSLQFRLPYTVDFALLRLGIVFSSHGCQTTVTTAMSFLSELWEFMRVRKKFWLLPILIMMVLLGGLIVLSQGSAVAPFIYTLF